MRLAVVAGAASGGADSLASLFSEAASPSLAVCAGNSPQCPHHSVQVGVRVAGGGASDTVGGASCKDYVEAGWLQEV